MKLITSLSETLLKLLARDASRIKDTDEARSFLSQRVRVENHWTFEHWRDGQQIDQWAFDNLVVNVGLNALLDNTFGAVPGSVAYFVGLIGAGTGTIALTTGTNTVTGTTTVFDAALAAAPIADIIIVGAGAAGADLITTVATRSSNTAITTTANAGTTVTVAPYATEPIPLDTMGSKSFNEAVPYSNGVRPTWTKNGAASAGAMSNSASKASFTINATSRIFGGFMASDSTKSGTTGTLYGGGLFVASGSRAVVSGDTLNVQVDLSVTPS